MDIAHIFLPVLAQSGEAPPAWMQFAPLILLMVGFWFLIIAPQRKKQKQHDVMLKELKSGDDVITTGGIYGTITNVKDDRFVIRVSDNVKVELTKASVATRIEKSTKS